MHYGVKLVAYVGFRIKFFGVILSCIDRSLRNSCLVNYCHTILTVIAVRITTTFTIIYFITLC